MAVDRHGLPKAPQPWPSTSPSAHTARTGDADRQSPPRNCPIAVDAGPAATRIPHERRRRFRACSGGCHAAVRWRLGEEVLAELTLRSLAPGGVPVASPRSRATLVGAWPDCAAHRRPPLRPPHFARTMGLSMGPCRVPRSDLAPADRRSRCRQMYHEPRLDPGYLGYDRTQGARGLLALERAELCVRRGGRKIGSGEEVADALHTSLAHPRARPVMGASRRPRRSARAIAG